MEGERESYFRNCLMLPSELAGGKYKICRASWLVGDSGKSVDVAILSAKRVIFRKISMLQSGGKIPSSRNLSFFRKDFNLFTG